MRAAAIDSASRRGGVARGGTTAVPIVVGAADVGSAVGDAVGASEALAAGAAAGAAVAFGGGGVGASIGTSTLCCHCWFCAMTSPRNVSKYLAAMHVYIYAYIYICMHI
jgi:hypothetical protein